MPKFKSMDNDDLRRPADLTPQALARWLPALYAAGKQYKFYKTPEWQALRDTVLRANHYECEDCRAKSPSVIRRATLVHHDHPTDRYPSEALSTYWLDEKGRKHQQLFALCEECHNARHKRFGFNEAKPMEKPLTPERW